jgi:hypothetical protein
VLDVCAKHYNHFHNLTCILILLKKIKESSSSWLGLENAILGSRFDMHPNFTFSYLYLLIFPDKACRRLTSRNVVIDILGEAKI